MIALSDVNRSFSDGNRTLEVLRSLNWQIEAGASVALMGRSGSGKTTLLNLLGCLDRGYTGSISIDGTDLQKMNDKELALFRNQTIGMIFQSYHLMDQLTCEENILLPTWFAGKSQVPASRAKDLLARVGLVDKLHQHPSRLSGGEKQRVAIARALVMEPRVLLCDEPTGNLDETTREEILDLFQELHKESGVTMILVTHEPRTAEIAQHLYQLKGGQLHLERDPEGTKEAQEGPIEVREETEAQEAKEAEETESAEVEAASSEVSEAEEAPEEAEEKKEEAGA